MHSVLRARFGVALIGLSLIACQASTGTSDPSQPRLSINSSTVSSSAPKGTPPGGTSGLTYTVQRGTISDTLNIPGRVVPAISAQITLQSPGTVAAVDVTPGQAVKKGDHLVEVAVDQSVLEAARTRATLADLEYDTQQAKVDDMQRGAAPDELAVAQASVASAQAELQKAQIQRSSLTQPDPVKVAAADNASKQVDIAQLAVKAGNDELGDAQAEVNRIQAQMQQTQTQAQAQAQTAAQTDADATAARIATATTAARVAAAATKAAQHGIDEATAKLGDAQAGAETTKVQQAIAAQQNQVAVVQQALHDAQATADGLDGSKDPTGVIAAAATNDVRNAGRQYGHEMDQLQLLQVQLDPARQADARGVKLAQIALDQAKDSLVQAQAAQKEADDTLQRALAGSPSPALAPSSVELQFDLPAAQARARDAQTKIDQANLQLDQAKAATQPVDTSVQDDARRQTADADIKIAQASLDAAQAKLAELQQGTAADALAREQTRAALLQTAANEAHAAVQPTSIALAPFDGTVSTISVGLGQLVDARTVAAQLDGVGQMIVKASATESDVTGLSVDQQVNVAFPNLGDNVTATGKILQISGAQSGSTDLGADSKVSYPVTVALDSVPPILKLGMSAMLNVNLNTARDVLYVPANAIRTVNDQTLATTVSPTGSLADTPITIGPTFGTNVQVLTGLHEGDVVTVFTPTIAGAKQR